MIEKRIERETIHDNEEETQGARARLAPPTKTNKEKIHKEQEHNGRLQDQKKFL